MITINVVSESRRRKLTLAVYQYVRSLCSPTLFRGHSLENSLELSEVITTGRLVPSGNTRD
jgi:hypothetical protein